MKGQSKTATTTAYLAELKEPRRSEVVALHKFIRKAVPGLKPFIHAGMLAYGPMRYRSASGREGDWFKVGVASNASAISLYACAADARGYVAERYKQALPKANIGKSCVRFRRFVDLDSSALAKLLKETARTGFTPGR
jgi:Domain of unknown function (DU1801)